MQSIFTTFAFVVSPPISLRRLAIAVVSSMMLLAMNTVFADFSVHLNVPLMAHGFKLLLRRPKVFGRKWVIRGAALKSHRLHAQC
jgi:membrane-anchored protein YejM (alkaline phosphatase superfamily)